MYTQIGKSQNLLMTTTQNIEFATPASVTHYKPLTRTFLVQWSDDGVTWEKAGTCASKAGAIRYIRELVASHRFPGFTDATKWRVQEWRY